MHRRRHLILFAAVTAVLFLALAGAASAKTRVFHANVDAKGTYVFNLGQLNVRRIKRASLRAEGVRTRIRGRAVRGAVRRGTLKVKPLRLVGAITSARHRRARLVVKLRPRRKHQAPASSGSGTPNTVTNPGGNGGGDNGGGNRPPVPTGNCEPGQVWKAGNWPGACWRPYNDESPFNRKVANDAPTASNSDAMVRKLTGFGPPDNMASNATGDDDWYHPIYYSQPSDPEFKIHCTEDWGTCDLEGMTVHVPEAAKPASAGDAHLAVIDQESGWEYDMFRVLEKPKGGGRMVITWGGKTRIDGDGLGSDASASNYGLAAGVIRAPELAAGRINHALFMVVKCSNGKNVFPAPRPNGSPCSSRDDAPAMGQRFQLDMSSDQIDSLDVPGWKKTILHAMAEYGMYVGDTGGGAWGLQFESSATYLSFGYADPFVSIGEQFGVPSYGRDRVFNIRDGVNWEKHLRVLDPCTAKGACS